MKLIVECKCDQQNFVWKFRLNFPTKSLIFTAHFTSEQHILIQLRTIDPIQRFCIISFKKKKKKRKYSIKLKYSSHTFSITKACQLFYQSLIWALSIFDLRDQFQSDTMNLKSENLSVILRRVFASLSILFQTDQKGTNSY